MKVFELINPGPKHYPHIYKNENEEWSPDKTIDDELNPIIESYKNGEDFTLYIFSDEVIYRYYGNFMGEYDKDYLLSSGSLWDFKKYMIHEKGLSEEDFWKFSRNIKFKFKKPLLADLSEDDYYKVYSKEGYSVFPDVYDNPNQYKAYKEADGTFRTDRVIDFWERTLSSNYLFWNYPFNKPSLIEHEKLILENMIIQDEVPSFPGLIFNSNFRVQAHSRVFNFAAHKKRIKVSKQPYKVFCASEDGDIRSAIPFYIKEEDELLERVGQRIDEISLEIKGNRSYILSSDYDNKIIKEKREWKKRPQGNFELFTQFNVLIKE